MCRASLLLCALAAVCAACAVRAAHDDGDVKLDDNAVLQVWSGNSWHYYCAGSAADAVPDAAVCAQLLAPHALQSSSALVDSGGMWGLTPAAQAVTAQCPPAAVSFHQCSLAPATAPCAKVRFTCSAAMSCAQCAAYGYKYCELEDEDWGHYQGCWTYKQGSCHQPVPCACTDWPNSAQCGSASGCTWNTDSQRCLPDAATAESCIEDAGACQNGGTCVDDLESADGSGQMSVAHHCECAAPFSGAVCADSERTCAVNNGGCLHGAQCVEDATSIECVCAAHYSGSFCQTLDDD